MMPAARLELRPILDPSDRIPVYAAAISPDILAGKSIEKINAIRLWQGNRKIPLSKIFEVSGKTGATPAQTTIEVKGDISEVRHLGENMTAGMIAIRGDAGMHLGAWMKGGTIEVHGNVDHWLGAEMTGGAIRVQGNVGDKAASAYLGSRYGMSGGTLYVKGNVGHELGMGMRRGVIVVDGNTGAFPGTRMLAGTIIVRGRLGPRAGAAMRYRGTIIALGEAERLMPTHLFNGEYESMLFLRLLLDAIQKEITGVTFTDQERIGPYLRYTGDFGSGGRGEILLFKPKNKHHLEAENNGGTSQAQPQ
jgi:formylmethanofuran dehydrogenase subunit C